MYFYGRQREEMFRIQERIDRTSRYVTLLSEPAVSLWRSAHGAATRVLLVPGAASAVIPPPQHNPYSRDGRAPVVFSGNFYSRKPSDQPEAHAGLTGKLNRLGALLHDRGARLYVVGTGDAGSPTLAS